MIQNIVKLQLRDKKDHYAVTFYKEIRNRLGITSKSILLLKIREQILIRIPNVDFAVTIPKKIIVDSTSLIEIEVIKIYNQEECLKRDNLDIDGEDVQLNALIPTKTVYGKNIFVLDFKGKQYVWYSVGGGVKPILINKNVNLIELAELIGFFFGDGSTSQSIRSFRLTNAEPSTLIHCLNILERIGISRNLFKAQIIYSSNTEINQQIKEKCIDYWIRILNLNRNQIISVSRSKAKTRSLEYGSARIFFDNSTFLEIMLHGVLKKFIEILLSASNSSERNILIGFMRGLAAAEGYVGLTKLNSLSKLSLSFDPHSTELYFYRILLKNLGVEPAKVRGNQLYIYRISNFKIFNEINLFKFHDTKKEKFKLGYKNHRYSP
ncbi:MAG TPA: hypothetical protein VFE88_04425 [Candidatus Nanoarchaeia archaeon]|nr:hypothetical protein [Candidatus Nanoarchaeia archaeon]